MPGTPRIPPAAWMRRRLAPVFLILSSATGAYEQPVSAVPEKLNVPFPVLKPATDLPKDAVCAPLSVFADRIFIPVKLNGEADVECLIDTGAEVSLLNKARVKLKELPIVGTQQLQGAFVGDVGMQQTRLKTLSIGSTAYPNVGMGVIEHRRGQKLERIDMLLGMDFLSRTRFTLDFARERFILWPFGSPLPPPPANLERFRVPMQRASGDHVTRPRVYGTVNEKAKALFLIDTGAGTFYFLALKKPEEYGLAGNGTVLATMRLNDGSAPRELKIRQTLIPRLDLDRLCLRQFTGKVVEAESVVGPVARQDLQDTYNVVGTPLLKTFEAVHFDVPGRCVYFDRPKAAAAEK